MAMRHCDTEVARCCRRCGEPEVPEEQRIRFRIGINLGDVIVEEHDIFGQGLLPLPDEQQRTSLIGMMSAVRQMRIPGRSMFSSKDDVGEAAERRRHDGFLATAAISRSIAHRSTLSAGHGL
jgi:hypothetical protein